jgi:hypothetical protein
MSDPMGELDPEILARALAKAAERGERLEDVIERRMREYISEGNPPLSAGTRTVESPPHLR